MTHFTRLAIPTRMFLFLVVGVSLLITAENSIAQVFARGGDTGASTRASGMGGAFVALADDSTGIFWNPAYFAPARTLSAEFSWRESIRDKVLNPIGSVAYSPNSYFGIGFGVRNRFHTGWNKFRESMWVLSVAGSPMKNRLVSAGLAFKRINVSSKTLTWYKAGGWGLDGGILIRIPMDLPGFPMALQFGVQLEDWSTVLKWANSFVEEFPILKRSGAALILYRDYIISFEQETLIRRNFDTKMYRNHLGMELWFLDRHVAIRGGLHTFEYPQLESMGFTGKYKGVGFHYSYSTLVRSSAGAHRISGSFEYSFGSDSK